MKETMSILLGSGFSVPEGLPSVKELNKRLCKINKDEILISTDLKAKFSKTDNNNLPELEIKKIFIQKFLEFYNSKILNKQEFHYETFYDFYKNYLRKKENKEIIENFHTKFIQEYSPKNQSDCSKEISDFDLIYNQLIAERLHSLKYHQDINIINYPSYDDFFSFILENSNLKNIKIHTLNHDLFFDYIGHHYPDLCVKFSDGFELAGSPFYGTVSCSFNQENSSEIVKKSYKVKLPIFNNKFDKPICLYKLHGSINTIVSTTNSNEKIRLKTNYAVSQFEKEVYDPQKKEYKFEQLIDEIIPDFLSGTTEKIRHYTKDSYYNKLFKHFENNLTNSNLLIVIGYGFQDSGINEYIEKHFLKAGKKMIVIDPYKPTTNLIEKYNATFIQKGITQITKEEYSKCVSNTPPLKKSINL